MEHSNGTVNVPAGQQTNWSPMYMSALLSQVDNGANECNSKCITVHVLMEEFISN